MSRTARRMVSHRISGGGAAWSIGSLILGVQTIIFGGTRMVGMHDLTCIDATTCATAALNSLSRVKINGFLAVDTTCATTTMIVITAMLIIIIIRVASTRGDRFFFFVPMILATLLLVVTLVIAVRLNRILI